MHPKTYSYLKYGLIALISTTSAAAIGAEIGHESVLNALSETANNQIAQAGFFFTIAAWIHSGRVKKEIKSNFQSLAVAINNVADTFREDLKKHSERLDNLSNRVQSLETDKSK